MNKEYDTTGAMYENGNWIVDVTDKAKSIFGAIVVRAYQIVGNYKHEFDHNSENYTRYILNRKDDTIVLDYGVLVVEFVTGKIVYMNTSEWGAVSNEPMD